MLQLQNIRKSYTTGDFTQVALNDVSVAFRDNEFVAILGPSGSGKTTMLNIIGGLDHYDAGNLVIDGVSTEQYKDRDWDTYRNNRIGFVFQSYNLIPHQTVLANVELALTLSGVSRDERRRRAQDALAKVGLAEHVNKKPSQLSGGQMQRVAIARALINDPEILLADEPTGALDSRTSVQIMDLLTEIANDRLVIMVTHNPELAEQYATRIVNLADGVIRSDTNPFEPSAADMRDPQKAVRRTSMSFLTALSLSFNNLMTKKGRTLMTAFAGSIGIIGIAAILSLANGVNSYIKSVEEDTLSMYPLQIMSTGFDMTAMMVGHMDNGESAGGAQSPAGSGEGASEGAAAGSSDDVVGEAQTITSMFSSIGSNDLASLKTYLDSGESDIDQYTSSIDYSYSVTPQIFDANTEDGVRQINPDTTFAAMGMGSSAYSNSLMSMSASTDMFAELMGDTSLVEDQYDLKAGHWPESYNECVLVLSSNGKVSDLLLYSLGLRDQQELKDMVSQFMNEEEVAVPEDKMNVSYDDLMGVKMKLVTSADYYSYDETYGVWVDKSDDEEYMRSIVNAGEDIVISGVVQPKPDVNVTALTSGIYYTPELTQHIIDTAATRQIVQDQLANSAVNVFNGKTFAEEESAESDSSFDMSSMFTIDTGAMQSAFRFDTSKLTIDPSTLDISMSPADMPAMPAPNPGDFAVEGGVTINGEKMGEATQELTKDYYDHYDEVAKAFQEKNGRIPNPSLSADQNELISIYMALPSTQQLMAKLMPSVIDTSAMQAELAAKVQAYMATTMQTYMGQVVQVMQAQVQSAMTSAMAQLSTSMAGAMSFDSGAFANAFQFNLDEKELSEIMASMMTKEKHSFDNNLAKLGYANTDKPSGIDIYPNDFESKQEVIAILDAYNSRMNDEGQEDKAISYTDIVGTLMKSVTTIIDMISYVLVAFVAISLVVSSIMIGVITYISVLERKKEIGILRSIGASKGDISRVFNAETIIEGLVAGILGVGITALGCIPVSAIVYALFNVPNVAQLPMNAAVVLVAISVFLTFIAGLMPASSASRKDPVEALRSE